MKTGTLARPHPYQLVSSELTVHAQHSQNWRVHPPLAKFLESLLNSSRIVMAKVKQWQGIGQLQWAVLINKEQTFSFNYGLAYI